MKYRSVFITENRDKQGELVLIDGGMRFNYDHIPLFWQHESTGPRKPWDAFAFGRVTRVEKHGKPALRVEFMTTDAMHDTWLAMGRAPSMEGMAIARAHDDPTIITQWSLTAIACDIATHLADADYDFEYFDVGNNQWRPMAKETSCNYTLVEGLEA